jgi:hypothetical protein
MAGIAAFAIDSAAGGDDYLGDGVGAVDQIIHEDGGALKIDGFVAFDLVHGLAGASFSGKMDHGVVAVEGVPAFALVADVAADEGDLRQVGQIRMGAVDLGAEVVQKGDFAAFIQEAFCETAADKAGTAGD